MNGSTTFSAAEVATAASKALPPLASMRAPAAAASGCAAARTPCREEMVGGLPFMDVPREPMEAAPHVKAAACARNLDLTVCDDARLQGALLVPTRRPVGDLHRGDHHALIALAGRDDLTSVGGVPESLVTPPSAKSMPRTGGQLMLKFYYNTAPNPTKVALLLEELGLPYEAIPL